MENNGTKQATEKIDIRKIFRDKNPGLAPYIPGFIYRYLDRILHVEFMNSFLERHGDKRGYDFAKASIEDFAIHQEIIGLENIPSASNVIFASNHPLGGFDGMLLITILGEKFPGLKVLVNDILTNIKNMDEVFVPINKHGKQSFQAVRKIEALFQEGYPVLTFPSGLVSRRKKGIIRDTEWQKNFVSKAIRYKRDIIPVYVSGRCTNFFYNLSNIRTFLGIKANLEMFFLPDETYRHRNEHIKVIFGSPIPWKKLDKNKTAAEWATDIQNHVYQLPQKPDLKF